MYIALTSTNELRADYVPQPPRGKWWRTPGRAKHVLIHSLANNQLKSSQPRLWHACSCSYHHFSSVNSTLSPSITPHSFTPSSKPTYSTNLSHQRLSFWPQDWLHRLYDWTVSSQHFGFLFFRFLHCSFCLLVLCGRLSWLFISFWEYITVVYRIISYCSTL